MQGWLSTSSASGIPILSVGDRDDAPLADILIELQRQRRAASDRAPTPPAAGVPAKKRRRAAPPDVQ